MYTLALQRKFIARHFLIGGDWGEENHLHSHPFRLEVRLTAAQLDQHGYLLDLVELEAQIDTLLERYRDATLNDLPEFEGLNPSIEHFSRILCTTLSSHKFTDHLKSIEVQLWEDESAWASFSQAF